MIMKSKVTIKGNYIYRNNVPIFSFHNNNAIPFEIKNKKGELLGYIVKADVGFNECRYITITDNKVIQRVSPLSAINNLDGVLKKDYKELIKRIE